MKLISFELKKIFRSPIVILAIIAVIGLDIFTVVAGGYQDEYCAQSPAMFTDIERIRSEKMSFAGAITPEWETRYKAESDAVLVNPKYRVSEEEAERIIQEQMSYGYTREKVLELSSLFLNEEGQAEFNKYEDVMFSAAFHENAAWRRDLQMEYYQTLYPGEKGQVLAAKAEADYNYLVEDHQIYYNYFWGFQKVRNLMTVYPYLVGVAVLIALAPIFSSEYSRRTDSLLLTSKHGKARLARAKIGAGLVTAAGIWAVLTLLNYVLIFSLYGTEGWEAYWQNWAVDYAAFPWNQGQITIVATLTSLLGTLYFALVLMVLSAVSKNQFVSIICGALLLLFPMENFLFFSSDTVNLLFQFLPTKLMMGVSIWQNYYLLYLFGKAVEYQYAAVVFAAAVSVATVPLATRLFTRHQVES